MRRNGFHFLSVVLAVICLSAGVNGTARAYFHDLPKNLAPVILSESVPFTFIPNEYSAADYRVRWMKGERVPGVELALGEESLEWVRVIDVFDLPRATLEVRAKNIEGGQVYYSGFTQPFLMDGTAGTVSLPVALISSPEVPVEVRIVRDGETIRGKAEVLHRPRPEMRHEVLYDPTCSPYKMRVEYVTPPEEIEKDSWIYFGCRLVHIEGSRYPRYSFELFVFWDQVGQTIEVNGVPTPSESISVWPLRLRQDPGKVRLKAGEKEIIVHYSVPDRKHIAFVGGGVGGYAYTLEGLGHDVHSVIPEATLYGSYFFSESMRVVAFSAVAIHPKVSGKLGLYLWNEQMRVFDDRFSMNVLLGAHVNFFQDSQGDTFLRAGGPQGIEFEFRDFLIRRHDVLFGGFFFPRIKNKAYYNAYVRWGIPERFIEFNYMAWLESVHDRRIYQRSVGISLGFPLAQFW